MFKSAVVKLTLWYLLIIMLISIFFSAVLFSVMNQEIKNNLDYQSRHFIGFGVPPEVFAEARLVAFQQLQRRELINLARFNLIVLILAGGASYILARRTLRPLEEAMESQSRFTGDASHELRTPLTAMRSEIEVALRDKVLTEPQARILLKSNLEEVVKLEQLSKALLQLARYSTNANEFKFSQLDISEPLKAAVSRMQKSAFNKKIKIEAVIKPINVMANEPSIEELFVTIIDNAIKYGQNGGLIKVDMTTSGKDALITFEDNGCGIAEKDLPLIFERFFRADKSRTKTQSEGYGLGLALASQIAKIHQGSISVSSRESEFSIFSIKLPLQSTPRLQSVSSAIGYSLKNQSSKK